MKRIAWIIVGWLALLTTTYADSLTISIGVTCDAKSGRVLDRFGYADANDDPKFAEVQ